MKSGKLYQIKKMRAIICNNLKMVLVKEPFVILIQK